MQTRLDSLVERSTVQALVQNLFFFLKKKVQSFIGKLKLCSFWTFRINLSLYILRLVAARLSCARLSCVSTRRKAMRSVRSGQSYSAKCRLLFCFCKKCCRSLKPLDPCCCALQLAMHACMHAYASRILYLNSQKKKTVPEMKKKLRAGRSSFQRDFLWHIMYIFERLES